MTGQGDHTASRPTGRWPFGPPGHTGPDLLGAPARQAWLQRCFPSGPWHHCTEYPPLEARAHLAEKQAEQKSQSQGWIPLERVAIETFSENSVFTQASMSPFSTNSSGFGPFKWASKHEIAMLPLKQTIFLL